MRIMAMRNWERPIRIAVILAMALTLLSPLGSAVFADDGTTEDPPSSEESEPPPEGNSEGEEQAPVEAAPVEETAPTDEAAPAEEAALTEEAAATQDAEAAEGSHPAEDAEAVAEDVPIEDETCLASEAVSTAADPAADVTEEAEETSTIADPYFYYGGTLYNYISIQDAVDELSSNGWTPDDGMIVVEDGTFTEDIVIDGSAWNGGADTPFELILQSVNGSGTTVIDGNVIIQNMLNMVLGGFEITGGVTAVDNTGTLTIEDVIATNADGDAISVENQTGDVILSNVNASNAGNGVEGDNIGSQLSENGQYGVWAQPENGTVTLTCVLASANELGAVMVPVGEEVIWIKCESKEDKEEDPYEDCVISDLSSKYVNVGDGMMVEFPPIDPIEDQDASYASYMTIDDPSKLPANLPEGDIFVVGIDILLYNAEIPEGETIKIEFFIPGYQWEENFVVLWFDADAVNWVDVPFTREPHQRIPGGKIVAEWDQPGTFVLVIRGESTPDA
ncbi:MAG: right-handed parallel beta-helix repeat-containing protein [Anaerolineales bacterium]